MAALARSAIRSRIAEAISVLDGWRESSYHIDLIGSDPRSAVHLSYAVGLGSTTPAALDRQRAAVGSVASTQVLVRWVHRMRASAQVGDYDAALDQGEALVAAVLAVEKDPGLSVTLTRYAGQALAGDGTYLISDVEFAVLHRLGLS